MDNEKTEELDPDNYRGFPDLIAAIGVIGVIIAIIIAATGH